MFDVKGEKEKTKKRMQENDLMIRMLAGAISNGKDYPALAIKNLDISNSMQTIEEVSFENKKVCSKAIGLYMQIDKILKDFIEDNNIKSDNCDAKSDLSDLINLL